MNQDEAFLADIAANPKDNTVRLIYADWLEDHGDADRAAFIRIQVKLDSEDSSLSPGEIARLKASERRLRSRHQERWLAPLRELGADTSLHGYFSRGFVEDVIIDAGMFIEQGERLWQLSPVVSLSLTSAGPQAARLSACPHLARVRRLTIQGGVASAAELATILRSPHLGNVEKLHLSGVPLTDADLPAVAEAVRLPALRQLALEDTSLQGRTLAVLLARIRRLESLGLPRNRQFDGASLAEALACLEGTSFQTLTVEWAPLGPAGLRALAGARHLGGITALWLRGSGLNAEALQALAGATHLAAVESLYLEDNVLGDEGLAALASWPGLRAVRTLDLGHAGIGPAGAEALFHSPHLGPVVELRLRNNAIGDAGARALAECKPLAGLRDLDLTDNQISSDGVGALVASPLLANLRELTLGGNSVGEEGAEALGGAASPAGLRYLNLSNAGVGRPAAHRLLVRLPALHFLWTDAGLWMDERIEAIREGIAAGGSEEDVQEAVRRQAVLAMLEDPDDDRAREMFADHLRDIGSPWWVPISLHNKDDWLPSEVRQRWTGWLEAGRDEWLAPLRQWARLLPADESFERGLLCRVEFSGALPNHAARSLASFPPLALLPLEVQRGRMTGEGAFQVLAHSPGLAGLTRLAFRAISKRELAHVLASPYLTALQELAFGPCGLGDGAAHLLAGSPAVAGLRVLDWGLEVDGSAGPANCLGPDGLAALGASPHLGRLRSLGLAGNRTVGDQGLRALLAAPGLAVLEALDLRGTGLGEDGVRALAASPRLAGLHSLRLAGNALGDEAVAALAGSPHLACLRELDLEGIAATDVGARLLAGSAGLSGLRILRVSRWQRLTTAGVEALRAGFGPRLSGLGEDE